MAAELPAVHRSTTVKMNVHFCYSITHYSNPSEKNLKRRRRTWCDAPGRTEEQKYTSNSYGIQQRSQYTAVNTEFSMGKVFFPY